MTEERKTVCKILRTMEPWPCKQAADEIERLAKRVEELERECGRFENELFEARDALAQSNAEPTVIKTTGYNMEGDGGPCTALAQSDAEQAMEGMGIKEAEPLFSAQTSNQDAYDAGFAAALTQSDAEPVRVTDEMVMVASDVLFERTSIAFGGTYMREALEAALNPEQVALYTAPSRPAQSDAEPHEELVTLEPREFVTKVTMDEVTMPNVAQSHAAAHVQHLRKRIRELEVEKRASYTAPPRPDASAGLIEALESLIIDCENKWGDPHTLEEARAALTALRARAADRSGK